MFRSWDEADSTLHRGDKVRLHLLGSDKFMYKNCDARFLASQAVDNDNVAWVLLQNCDGKRKGSLTTEIFRLKDLERIK